MKNSINILNSLNESLEEEFKAKRQLKEASFKDKVSAIKKSLKKNDKKLSNKSAEKSAEKIAGSMIKNEAEDNDFYNYVKGLLDSGVIDDPEYYNSLSDEEKEDLIKNTWMKDKDIINDYNNIQEAQEFVITYIPDNNQKDKTATISIQGNNKQQAAQQARQTIGDAAIVSIQLLNENIKKGRKLKLKEEDSIKINQSNVEPDYIISDVTILNQVNDGDIQSPDIEALLTLVDESLKSNYSNEWGKINILSSRINENSSFALVDISTPEILKEFEEKGIHEVAIGKNLILENVGKLVEFKVNNLNGTTKYIKKTNNPQQSIYEWIESEFLHEAKKEKEAELEVLKAKTEKETVENYINNRIDLKQEIENIKMFIEISKEIKAKDEMKPSIQRRMYAFAAEVPHSIEVKSNKNDQYELSFSNLDQVVEMIFGKEWVAEPTEDNKVVGVIKENEQADILIKDYFNHKMDLPELHNKLEKVFGNKKDAVEYFADNETRIKTSLKESTLNEAYEQFNIGNIEVVFNPGTYECLYSIPSADVKDKKINLTKVPTVDTPYDTNTIIKSYIETKFGRIPTEEEKKVQDNNETPQPSPESPEPQQEEQPVDVNINIDDEDLTEDELPEEPSENEPEQPVEDNEEVQAETGNAVFMKIRPKQSVSIEDLRSRQLDGDTPTSSYIVVDNIDLPSEEFNQLIDNLNEPRAWLEGIQAIDRKNYSFNVIKVTNSAANFDLLIDPLGYRISTLY